MSKSKNKAGGKVINLPGKAIEDVKETKPEDGNPHYEEESKQTPEEDFNDDDFNDEKGTEDELDEDTRKTLEADKEKTTDKANAAKDKEAQLAKSTAAYRERLEANKRGEL